MKGDLKPIGTNLHDITDKVMIPEKLPVPPKLDLPGLPPLDASTSFLDDLILWFRNRLKRMASQEGGGIDAGKLLPSIGGILGLIQYWPIALAVLVILGILFAMKVF